MNHEINRKHHFKMKMILLFICYCVFIRYATGQQPEKIEPDVIASAGTQMVAGNLKVDWTLGEFAIYSLGVNLQATQGFHQGNLKISTGFKAIDFQHDVQLYPNPTADYLLIDLKGINGDVFLFDMTGHRTHAKENIEKTQLNLARLPSGSYTLQVWSENKLVNVSTIQKF